MNDDLLTLFPGALGDFICFRPTLLALRAQSRGRIAIAARPALFDLLPPGEFEPVSIDRSEIADLFADGPLSNAARELFGGFTRAMSWTGHGDPCFAERLARVTGGQVAVHPFRQMSPGEHAVDYYARCANIQPLTTVLEPAIEARQWAASFWRHHGLTDRTLAVHPGSGSTAKNWQGMLHAAARWRKGRGARVLTLLGPAEEGSSVKLPNDAEARHEPLDRVAALLQRSCLYLGNDSGVSHLAALVGTPCVVLFGPSDPGIWRPRGPAVRVVHAAEPCSRCGSDVFCTHRLPVTEVFRAVEGAAASLAAAQIALTSGQRER